MLGTLHLANQWRAYYGHFPELVYILSTDTQAFHPHPRSSFSHQRLLKEIDNWSNGREEGTKGCPTPMDISTIQPLHLRLQLQKKSWTARGSAHLARLFTYCQAIGKGAPGKSQHSGCLNKSSIMTIQADVDMGESTRYLVPVPETERISFLQK